jgi:hypothetical protein
MHILAVMGLEGPPETWASVLAKALGRTPGELLGRVRAVAPGPAVIATFGDEAQARAVARVLVPTGLQIRVADPTELMRSRARVFGRRFFLPETAGAPFTVETRAGSRHSLVPAAVRCLIRVTGHWEETGTETETHRRFAAGRAMLSGGLLLTRKVTVERQTVSHNSAAVLMVDVAEGPTFVLHETELIYDALGEHMEASRTANFNLIVETLRGACPAAVYDDRLLSRGGQVRVLGPSINPDTHVELAATLVALALRGDFAGAGQD